MGQGASSDPELMKASTTYFALIFKQIDKLEIVNAGKDVVHIFEKILSPRNLIQGTRYKDETETYKIKIHGMPFTLAAGSSVDFKISFLHILDQLYIELQMVPFVSSDLCLSTDTSTVFFEKEFENTSRGHYVCIAPSGHDCLDLINFPPNVQTQIISIIQSSWGTSDVTEKINQCFRVKMVGHPWSFGARGENATLIRRLLLKIVQTMKFNSYKYVVNISMKGTCDMMYFQYDPTIIPDSSQSFIMYLSKRDRVRLIDAPDHVKSSIKSAIEANWSGGIMNERVHNHALEFKLKGNPWYAYHYDTIPSRVLISSIFKEMRQMNFKCIGTLDISRRSDDKSVFLFESNPTFALPPSINIRWTCLYFCGRNKLILVGAHQELVELINQFLGPIVQSNGTYDKEVYLWRFSNDVFSYSPLNNSEQEKLYKALIVVYENMKVLGWELVSSADVSSIVVKRNDKYVSYDTHSWYFLNIRGNSVWAY